MAEIEITLPSVQYGNVKIKATPEEWGLEGVADAANVGVWAAIYLNLFQQGFRHGATLDVDAHLGALQEAYAPGAREGAERQLDASLKPRTVDEADEMAKLVIERGLGGVTELSEEEAAKPWNQKLGPKAKPWENQEAAPVSEDW